MYIYNFLIHFFKAVDQPKERLQSDQTTPSAPDFQDLPAGRDDESSSDMRQVQCSVSVEKMSWKKRDDSLLLWGVVVLLIGTTILIASHSVYKGIQLDLLHEEVRELRYQLNKLQVKEDEVEVEVNRQRRQVDLFSKPEVLDYAYNAQLPDSDSNLSVYDKWFSDKNDHLKHGLSKHHKVSASWSETGNDYDDNDNVGEEFTLFNYFQK